VNITSNATWTVSESIPWLTVTPTTGSNNGSISVSVIANNGIVRNGVITLTAACGTVITITVNQAAPCNLSASAGILNFSALTENQTVNITSNTTWTVSESIPWLTVTPTTGSNNGSISVSVIANTGSSVRSGAITVTAACGTEITITVNQAAPCNLSASAISLDFLASADNQTVNISSNSTWTVSESLIWIAVTPLSGLNNGSITVSVTANPGAFRTGTITVTAACGTTVFITVNQGACVCLLSVSTSTLSFPATAGNQPVNVTSNSSWTVSESLSWVSILPTTGSNNGSFKVYVTTNPGAFRTGTITLTAACGTAVTITVNQGASDCLLSVSTGTLDFSASAGNQTVNISSNSNWTVSESLSWVTVTPTTGSNSSSITVSVIVNPGIARSGIITLTAACGTAITITVNQAALCNLSSSASTLDFPATDGNKIVIISSNSSWTVSESLSWVTVTPITGSNNSSITVTVIANSGIARSGIITLTAACGSTITITVNQIALCSLAVSTSLLEFSSSAGNQTVSINSNSNWTVSESLSWVAIIPTTGSNNGSFKVYVMANQGAFRTGTIKVTLACGMAVTITVNQSAVSCLLSVSTSTINFSASAGNQTLKVTSNSAWTVSESLSWLIVTPTSGSNNSNINVSVIANPGIARSGIITLTAACGTVITITVNQVALCFLTASSSTLDFSAAAGNQTLNIISYSSWTVSESISWLSVTPASGSNNSAINVSVIENPGAARTGNITLTAICGTTVIVTINQSASGCLLTTSTSTLGFSAAAGNQTVNITSYSSWTVSESISWLSVTPTSGSNNSSINVSVLANPGAARTGIITLTAACGTTVTITINQSANNCLLNISSSTLDFSPTAGSQTISITSNSTWTVSESLSWLSVTPTSGSNNSNINVSVIANPGAARTGIITLTAACGTTVTITINQSAGGCLLTTSSSTLDFSAAAGNQTISITSNSNWIVSESLSWVAVTPATGFNNGSFKAYVMTNPGAFRTGTIRVAAACGATVLITVNQNASD